MTMKLTGTGGQTKRRTDKQDHVLSQADALTKNSAWEEPATYMYFLMCKACSTCTAVRGGGGVWCVCH